MSPLSPSSSGDFFVAGYHYPPREPILYPACIGINESLSLTEPFFAVKAIAEYERRRAMIRIPVFHDYNTADPALLPYPMLDPLHAPRGAKRVGTTTSATEVLRRAKMTKVTLAAEAIIARQYKEQNPQQPQQNASGHNMAQASRSVSAGVSSGIDPLAFQSPRKQAPVRPVVKRKLGEMEPGSSPARARKAKKTKKDRKGEK